MNLVLKDIRRNPLLWLLVFVPVLLIAVKLRPGSHTMLFLLSVLAIIPLAALLSLATESVAAKTGDAVGGLLNATLGNLTELVIALAALQAGDYALVKASIAGAIVANTLFMLGASMLLGGLKHHTQEFNRAGARLQDSLLFLATVALLIPSLVGTTDSDAVSTFVQELSLWLSILLIAAYGLGLVFSLGTHRELFQSGGHAANHEEAEEHWPMGLALTMLAIVTLCVALVSEIFVEFSSGRGRVLRHDPGLRWVRDRRARQRRRGNDGGIFGRAQGQVGPQHQHRAGQRRSNCAVRRARARSRQLFHRAKSHEPPTRSGHGGNDPHRYVHRDIGDERRALRLVSRGAHADRLRSSGHDGLSASTPGSMT